MLSLRWRFSLKWIKNDINEIKQDNDVDDVVIESYKEKLTKTKNLDDINIYDFNDDNTINLDKLINNFNELIKNDEYDTWTLNHASPDKSNILIHLSDNCLNDDDAGWGDGTGNGDGTGDGGGSGNLTDNSNGSGNGTFTIDDTGDGVDTSDGAGDNTDKGGDTNNDDYIATSKNMEDKSIPKE